MKDRGSQRRTSGYAIVWILVCIALLAAGLGSLEFLVDERAPNHTMYWVFGIGSMVAAVGLFIEAKRDLYTMSGAWVMIGSIIACLTGAVALLGTKPHPLAATAAALSTLGVVASLVHIIRIQFARESLPNVIRERFAPGSIYEIEGVQFVAPPTSSQRVAAGEDIEIVVFVQNGWDQPREFVFELRNETRISLNTAGLTLPRKPAITLPGGGTRLRRWRAKAMSTRLPSWIRPLAILAGYSELGAGIPYELRVEGSARPSRLDPEVRTFETEIIWEPSEEALRAAASDRPRLVEPLQRR